MFNRFGPIATIALIIVSLTAGVYSGKAKHESRIRLQSQQTCSSGTCPYAKPQYDPIIPQSFKDHEPFTEHDRELANAAK